MWSEPVITAAFIGAVAGLGVAIVGLVPRVGRLHRLERVVSILEKVKEPGAREPLIALRDRLIDGYRPRESILGMRFVVSVVSNALAAASIGLGVWVRAEGAGALAAFAGPLIVGGIVLALGGLGALLWALAHARQERGPRRVAPKPIAEPKSGG